jgi:uncharacterized protein YegL
MDNIHIRAENPLDGGVAARPLHIFFLLDGSTSMQANRKIETLNQAMREVIPELIRVVDAHPGIEMMVRALVFADRAKWLGESARLSQFKWTDVDAEGYTAMGEAMRLLAAELESPPMPARFLPPVAILLSDGDPTDDFEGGLAALEAAKLASKAIRVSIAIGDKADHGKLLAFMSPNMRPNGVLQAKNSRQLVEFLKFASTTASRMATQGQAPDAKREKVWTPPPMPLGEDKDWIDF